MRSVVRTPYAWCTFIVAAEAVLILWPLGQSQGSLLGVDGADYNQYALNLVRHGVFSNAVSAPFYPGVTRTPGYPAFLALIHLIGLHFTQLTRLAQFALVAVLGCLVYGIALELADVRSARISAALIVTYLPFLWYATHALTEVLASVLATLLVFLLVKARKRPTSVRLWIAVGLTLAAGAYVRPEVAGLGVLVALGVLLTGRGRYVSRSRLLPPAIVLATMVVALAPWMIRNVSVAHSFVPLDASSGYDLLASADQYAGTIHYEITDADWTRFNVQANAIIARVEPKDLANAITLRVEPKYPTAREQVAANNALTRQALKIMSHLSVGTVLKGVPRRLAYLWGTADVYPQGRSWSTVAHRLAQLQYALLVVLILAGIVMRRRLLAKEWPLWIIAAYLTVLHLVSHVEARYTLPARAPLFVYAGVAVAAVVGWIGRATAQSSSRRRSRSESGQYVRIHGRFTPAV
jgi:4-amino-4-deoxy-L-arabinose transferase-like glycosyltransferase